MAFNGKKKIKKSLIQTFCEFFFLHIALAQIVFFTFLTDFIFFLPAFLRSLGHFSINVSKHFKRSHFAFTFEDN